MSSVWNDVSSAVTIPIGGGLKSSGKHEVSVRTNPVLVKDKVDSTNQIAQSYNDGIIRVVAQGNNNTFDVGFSQHSREIQSKLSNNINQTAEKFLASTGL